MVISGSCLRPDRDGDALLRGGAPHRRDLFRAPEPPRIAARDEAHTAETPRGQAERGAPPLIRLVPFPKLLVVIVNGFWRHRVLKRFGRHPPQPCFAARELARDPV